MIPSFFTQLEEAAVADGGTQPSIRATASKPSYAARGGRPKGGVEQEGDSNPSSPRRGANVVEVDISSPKKPSRVELFGDECPALVSGGNPVAKIRYVFQAIASRIESLHKLTHAQVVREEEGESPEDLPPLFWMAATQLQELEQEEELSSPTAATQGHPPIPPQRHPIKAQAEWLPQLGNFKYLPEKIQKALVQGDAEKLPVEKKYTLHAEEIVEGFVYQFVVLKTEAGVVNLGWQWHHKPRTPATSSAKPLPPWLEQVLYPNQSNSAFNKLQARQPNPLKILNDELRKLDRWWRQKSLEMEQILSSLKQDIGSTLDAKKDELILVHSTEPNGANHRGSIHHFASLEAGDDEDCDSDGDDGGLDGVPRLLLHHDMDSYSYYQNEYDEDRARRETLEGEIRDLERESKFLEEEAQILGVVEGGGGAGEKALAVRRKSGGNHAMGATSTRSRRNPRNQPNSHGYLEPGKRLAQMFTRFNHLRTELFAEQTNQKPPPVVGIGSSGGVKRSGSKGRPSRRRKAMDKPRADTVEESTSAVEPKKSSVPPSPALLPDPEPESPKPKREVQSLSSVISEVVDSRGTGVSQYNAHHSCKLQVRFNLKPTNIELFGEWVWE